MKMILVVVAALVRVVRCPAVCLRRRGFGAIVLSSVIGCTPFLLHGARPNVVIFLTDDQGWGDLSFNGNRNLSTPNIDSIAREGAMFDNFYVCAVCAPTRAEFLTGRYHPRTGVSGVSR